MKFPDLWSTSFLGLHVVLAVLNLLAARHWNKIRKATAPIAAEARRDPARFFFGFMVASALALGALILLAINLQQTSPKTQVVSLLAAVVEVMILTGIVGQALYHLVAKIREEQERFDGQLKEVLAENQRLEEKVKAFEVLLLTESRRKEFPVPRKSSVRSKQLRQKKEVNKRNGANPKNKN